MVQALRFPITLPRRIDERQITRFTGGAKPFRQRDRDLFGKAGADKPTRRDSITAADHLHGIGGAHYFIATTLHFLINLHHTTIIASYPSRASNARIAAAKYSCRIAVVTSPRVRSSTARSASVVRRSPPVIASGKSTVINAL